MLTIPEMAAILDRFTYKPGWSFRVREGRWEGAHLEMVTCVVDAFHPDQMVTLDVHVKVPPMETEAEFLRYLMWRLGRHEIHEVREWAKIDGKVIDSPHKPNADRDL